MPDATARDDWADPATLVNALAEARAALAAAESEATEELIAAKAAYRDDPSPENAQRKAAAVERIQALRAAVRADRPAGPGAAIGGDAYIVPPAEAGGEMP